NQSGHHIRTGTRVQGADLYGRIIHLRQRRDRQQTVGNQSRQQQCKHRQRRRNRTLNENPGQTHEIGDSPECAATTRALVPSRKRSTPSITTFWPTSSPDRTAVLRWSL